MAIIATTTDLGVLNRYTKLMQTSVGSGSIYIRTKETLMFNNITATGSTR